MKRHLTPALVIGSALLAAAGTASATLVFTPVSTAGATATATTEQFPASNAIDGNFGNFTHTFASDTNPTLTMTLASAASFNTVRIYNRGDGCCPYRLRDITVGVYTGAGDVVPAFSSGLLNPGNVLSGPAILTISPGAVTAQKITVNRTPTTGLATPDDNSVLSVGEIVIGNTVDQFLPLNTNITHASIVGLSVSQSSDIGYPAGNALNGNNGDFTHTSGSDVNPWWQADMGEAMQIQQVNMHNRESCCQGRLRDITITVFNDPGNIAGSTVYTSPVLNPGGSLGGPADLNLDIQALNGGLPVTGRYVRISRAGLGGVSDDNNVLSLGEVNIIGGSAIPEPAGIALLAGVLGLAAVRRRR